MAGDPEGKKRMAIIAVSSLLLVAMVIAAVVGMSLTEVEEAQDPKDGGKPPVTSSLKAVQTICQPTDYKTECVNTLKAKAGNTTDPRELVKIAFDITIQKMKDAANKSQLLYEVEKDPRAKMALDTCRELVDLSAEEFRRSVDKVTDFDINNVNIVLENLKVWLSSAVTYQQTCLDGFENATGSAGQKMKDALRLSMKLSSNALAIINEMARTLSEFNIGQSDTSRRLLQRDEDEDENEEEDDDEPILGHDEVLSDLGDLPSWPSGADRKLLSRKGKRKPNVIVAKDGRVKTINEALKLVPRNNQKAFIIYIKEGVYQEYITILSNMTHVVMIGEGATKTRITGNRNFVDGFTTYKSCTFAVEADNFIAVGLGFENSAGPSKHQAVALRVRGDKAIFYKCHMDGYQDTLYAHAERQYYRDCTISGTIDFVFGDATSLFQNCVFKIRRPMDNQQCIVTAQGRKDRHQTSGILIQGGSIVADPEYYPVRKQLKSYLARPWKLYSRTIFMNVYIDESIQPEGFLPWQGNLGLDTLYYVEYNNSGPGSDKSHRVNWPGIHNITAEEAHKFEPRRIFPIDDWIRATGVPYYNGLDTTSDVKKKH